jgi:predicted DNA-binding transcriptional regulator YafY
MNDVITFLLQAAEAGEVIEIIYHGGSQPGAVRRIAPIEIDGDCVRAVCIATRAVKHYKLAKIEISSDSAHTSYSAQRAPATPKPANLHEAIQPYEDEIRGLGWELVTEPNRATVFRRFKNGKLRKTYDVIIEYYEYTYTGSTIGPDGTLTKVQEKSRRPWYVRCSDDRHSTFKELAGAAARFAEFAREAAVALNIAPRDA